MTKKAAAQQSESAIYNIKAVVTQTGLNPATIRAWERRYGLPKPQRSGGGHRQYSQRDVDMLRWLIAQQETGMSISHAVELWQTIKKEGKDPLILDKRTIPGASTTSPVLGKQIEELREVWINACLSFDRESAERVLTHAFSLFPPEIVCFEILQKGLVEIGDGWHEGNVTVQQEHFTTTLSEQKLEVLIAAAPAPTRRERIVVTAAPKERHTFGSYLLTYLLRRQGWDVIQLGADVPLEDFGPTIEKLEPDLIIASAQLLNTAASIKDVALIAQEKNIPLAFGGRAFNQIPEMREFIPGFYLGETLEEAVKATGTLLANRPENKNFRPQEEKHQEALLRFCEKRSLLESHLWANFVANNKPTHYLTEINDDIAAIIVAALKLGDISLLSSDMKWIEELLLSYRQPSSFINKYVKAYHAAAEIHLDESAKIITIWLDKLVNE